ncbi:MAG: hypothetical protein WCA45_00395 [Thiobacillaceae bacterium]
MFQIVAAFVPEYRQKGEDKVGLVELDPFAVDTDEDVGHLLLVNRWGDLQSGEGVFLQVEQAIEVVAYALFLFVCQRCLGSELGDEIINQLAARFPR